MAPIINTISIGDIYLNNVWEENKYDMFQKNATSDKILVPQMISAEKVINIKVE